MRQFARKPFQAPKILFKSPKLIGQKMLPYEHILKDKRFKSRSSHFSDAQLSDFATWELAAKEDLNSQKQVFLLNLRLWPAQKPKTWSIFYGKKFM